MPPLKTSEITTALTGLAEEIKGLSSKFELFLESQKKPEPLLQETEIVKETVAQRYPIPSEYRDIIDIVLNKKFGIEIEPLSDRPAFQFTIVVPREYSNALAEHFTMYGSDRRPKVLSFAEGPHGVREWAEKVLNNLSQDARTKIAMDRAEYKTL